MNMGPKYLCRYLQRRGSMTHRWGQCSPCCTGTLSSKHFQQKISSVLDTLSMLNSQETPCNCQRHKLCKRPRHSPYSRHCICSQRSRRSLAQRSSWPDRYSSKTHCRPTACKSLQHTLYMHHRRGLSSQQRTGSQTWHHCPQARRSWLGMTRTLSSPSHSYTRLEHRGCMPDRLVPCTQRCTCNP